MGTGTMREGSSRKVFSQEDKDAFEAMACQVVDRYMDSMGKCIIPLDIQMKESHEMYKAGDIIYSDNKGPFIMEVEDYFATVDGTGKSIIFFSCENVFGPNTVFRTKKTKVTNHHPEDFIAVPIKYGHIVTEVEDGVWNIISRPDFPFEQVRTSIVNNGIYDMFRARVGQWNDEKDAYGAACREAHKRVSQLKPEIC